MLFSTACGSESSSSLDSEKEGVKTQSEQPKKRVEKKPLSNANLQERLLQIPKEQLHKRFRISTSFGDIEIELFEDTPIHYRNFNYLVQRKYFDQTWFYRVSPGHVIQAGNDDSRETVKKRSTIGEYSLPAEFSAGHHHFRGAIAAARSYHNNPDKRSDPYEFYIVIGKSYSAKELGLLLDQYEIKLSETAFNQYVERGGAPHLDKEHTVFGRVISGMEVVYQIAQQPTDSGEWPLTNIPIEVKALP